MDASSQRARAVARVATSDVTTGSACADRSPGSHVVTPTLGLCSNRGEVTVNQILINLGIVVVFILIGGFFAASELALVSLRESQIDHIDQKEPAPEGRLRRLARD